MGSFGPFFISQIVSESRCPGASGKENFFNETAIPI
jgi:hypothetical protein